jgi:hypothetical protein
LQSYLNNRYPSSKGENQINQTAYNPKFRGSEIDTTNSVKPQVTKPVNPVQETSDFNSTPAFQWNPYSTDTRRIKYKRRRNTNISNFY